MEGEGRGVLGRSLPGCLRNENMLHCSAFRGDAHIGVMRSSHAYDLMMSLTEADQRRRVVPNAR